MVKEFSLKLQGDDYVSTNFRVSEFKCKDGSDTILIDTDFVADKLQKIRDHFQKSVIIVSAYRTPEHNKNIKGATNSYHLKGMAFDISVAGVSPKQVCQFAETLGIKGIIQYNGFSHIDSRDTKYFAINDNDKITIKNSFV
jgi:hypothetical protein